MNLSTFASPWDVLSVRSARPSAMPCCAKSKKATAETVVQRARRLVDEGHSTTEVVSLTGLSATTVRRMRREWGTQRQPHTATFRGAVLVFASTKPHFTVKEVRTATGLAYPNAYNLVAHLMREGLAHSFKPEGARFLVFALTPKGQESATKGGVKC
jgi:hypothetical protein